MKNFMINILLLTFTALAFTACTNNESPSEYSTLNSVSTELKETETDEPKETESPHPTVTIAPSESETKQPVITDVPKETEQPAITDVPKETEQPVITDVPKETEKPVITDVPKETEKPVITDVPKETEQPAITDVPKETEQPVITDVPKETETKKDVEPEKYSEAWWDGYKELIQKSINDCLEEYYPGEPHRISYVKAEYPMTCEVYRGVKSSFILVKCFGNEENLYGSMEEYSFILLPEEKVKRNSTSYSSETTYWYSFNPVKPKYDKNANLEQKQHILEKFEEYAKGIIDNRKAKGAHPVVDYCADDFVIRKDNDALLETYWKDDRGYIYVVPLWYNSQSDSLNTAGIQDHLINTRENFIRVGDFLDDSFDEETPADLGDEDILFHCFWIFANDVSEGVEPRVLFDSSVYTFHRKPGEPVWPK